MARIGAALLWLMMDWLVEGKKKKKKKHPHEWKFPKKKATHSSEGRCDLLDMSSLCCRFFDLFQFSKTDSVLNKR